MIHVKSLDLVCAGEYRKIERGNQRLSLYWVTHRASLVRVADDHVRAELPHDRTARLQHMPHTAAALPVQHQVVNALKPVRGPVRFLMSRPLFF